MSWITKLSGILLAVLCLAGCARESTMPEPTMAIATPTPAAKEAEMKVSIPQAVTSWHPLLANQREIQSLLGLVFEPLVELDEEGNPTGCLAASWEQNGQIWTFNLRTQAHWQGSGKDFTADDVIGTMNLIVEIGEISPWYTDVSRFSSWEKSDDHTLTLTAKTASWGNILALEFPIIPAQAGYTATAYPEIAMGTGAYQMETAPDEEGVAFIRSSGWWRQKPSIEKIIAVPYSDSKSAASAIMLQQLDVQQSDDLVSEQFSYGGDVKAYQYASPYFEFLAFQCQKEPMSSVDFRNAVALALDRQDLAENVYMDHAAITDAPFLPSKALYGTHDPEVRNLDVARELLSHFHGLGDMPVTLLASENKANPLRQEAAEHISQHLAQVGIHVDVVVKPWEEYVSSLQTGDYDMALAGWYLSPVPDLHFCLDEGAEQNIFFYHSEGLDSSMAILDQASSDSFSSAALSLSQRLQTERPFVSLYFLNHTLLTSARVRGVGRIFESCAFSSIENWFFSVSGY